MIHQIGRKLRKQIHRFSGELSSYVEKIPDCSLWCDVSTAAVVRRRTCSG